MRKLFTLFTIFLLLSSKVFSSNHFEGDKAATKVPGTSELWYKGSQTLPSFIRFSEDFKITEAHLFSWMRGQFNLPIELHFIEDRVIQGQGGLTHKSFRILYDGQLIEFQQFKIHLKGSYVHSVSGNLINAVNIVNAVTISKTEALNKALQAVNANVYKWQLPNEENWLKVITQDLAATFYPTSAEVLVPALNGSSAAFRHAYKLDVYSHEPFGREEVYIDAESGEVLLRNSLIKGIDSIGTAHTGYSDIQQIRTNFLGNFFILDDQQRGKGVRTYNMQRTYNFAFAIDFTDGNNIWDENKPNFDQFATDAHWGTEMTYDYFKLIFNRNSIDDDGYPLTSFVHWGEGENKATWDGYRVLFGDGGSSTLPLTTLDITAHEITHGLIDHTANFVYLNESGALCESFCDIFGNCVEKFGKPNRFSWRIGDDRGAYFSDMSNPNVLSAPDTYHGQHWYEGPDDFGGVHKNSGVHNYWFYLLTEGGNGINDIDNLYDVRGIGMNNAAMIAYESLTAYLSPQSDFEEARFYSIQVAKEIFGICSPQHEAVVNAWHAVGIGEKLITEASAEFTADRTRFCTPPFTVNFENKSLYDFKFIWDFGDGTKDSINQHPSHTYTQAGQYSIQLSIDGDGCGSDVAYKSNLIDGSIIEAPTGRSVIIYEGERAWLNAVGKSGVIQWYEDEACEKLIFSGATFQTPELNRNTSYYLKSVLPGIAYNVGPGIEDNQVNGSYSKKEDGLIFDLYQDILITSIQMNSRFGGTHKIQIRDENSTVIFETNVLVEPGVQEVILNAQVPMGNDYTMVLAGEQQEVWMSNTVSYPYIVSGVVSIKGDMNTVHDAYPYFFNWKIKEKNCGSEVHQIDVSVNSFGVSKYLFNDVYSKNEILQGNYKYYIKLDVPSGSSVQYGLYNINGQRMLDFTDNEVNVLTETNLNQLLGLDNYTHGVYFLTVKGVRLDLSKRIILKEIKN